MVETKASIQGSFKDKTHVYPCNLHSGAKKMGDQNIWGWQIAENLINGGRLK